ncbi:MAG: amidase [Candidatus Eremiobacteraeota bacterium]|nr:amidase [Candidatus Eremiobacteraeota bacterium]
MTTALLVVDIQRALTDYLDPARRVGFLDTVAALVKRARQANVPVVYVRHNDAELRVGTKEWEITEEIGPRPGEPIVDKQYRDAFRETHLADVLRGLAADHVVVCGMQTEFCIDATIREAERRGYRVTLVEDAHATYPVDGATEEQIRAQIHRVARGSVAAIVPAAEVFAPAVR